MTPRTDVTVDSARELSTHLSFIYITIMESTLLSVPREIIDSWRGRRCFKGSQVWLLGAPARPGYWAALADRAGPVHRLRRPVGRDPRPRRGVRRRDPGQRPRPPPADGRAGRRGGPRPGGADRRLPRHRPISYPPESAWPCTCPMPRPAACWTAPTGSSPPCRGPPKPWPAVRSAAMPQMPCSTPPPPPRPTSPPASKPPSCPVPPAARSPKPSAPRPTGSPGGTPTPSANATRRPSRTRA